MLCSFESSDLSHTHLEGPGCKELTFLSVVCSLRAYAEKINEAASRLSGELAVAAKNGTEVEMWRLYGAMTMEVVGGAAFG